jgi:hypothetical protein
LAPALRSESNGGTESKRQRDAAPARDPRRALRGSPCHLTLTEFSTACSG